MTDTYHKLLDGSVKSIVMELACPNCGKRFKPFGDREITSKSDMDERAACPNCRAMFTLKELSLRNDDDEVNPSGPVQRPAESRIELRGGAGDTVAFYFPPTGRWGIWPVVTILWNVFAWAMLTTAISRMGTKQFELQSLLISLVLAGAGVCAIGATVFHRFGSTLLELSPEFVRLQRFLSVKVRKRELPTAEVQKVSKVEFYQQNYKPVYGIEIKGRRARIRFGSSLTEDEKNWLCWEILEYARKHKNQASVDPAITALTRRS